jgi:long-chain acyl-CoA synthetase
MEAKHWLNLVEMFFAQAERKGDEPFLWQKQEGHYESVSWKEAAKDVARLAWALRDMGVEKGDPVVLVSESRTEWPISDLAIMACGAISVPTYITNTIRDHTHILENSGAKAAIVSTARLARSFLPAAHESDMLRHVICIESPKISQSLNVDIHLWDNAMLASKGKVEDFALEAASIPRDEIACLIYTSGTGGAPKGVMLHHGSILHNCTGAAEMLDRIGIGDEVFLSFLPLSHAYEHTAGLFLPISLGAQIYYAEGLDKLAANMEETHPTVMTVVPRLFEVLQARVIKSVEDKGGIGVKLFQKALALGTQKYLQPGTLSGLQKIQDGVLDKLVRNKIRNRFGGRIKALVAGGAPLNPDCGIFFTALGLRLLQGYGQTESGPVISINDPLNVKLHTVGPPVAATEVVIAEDGEIIVRGELVMKGYWRDDTATANAIKDGWLHTGDIGILDEDGQLQITDRKKDIIVNDKGENISPSRIEGMLTLEPEIGQAMVYGDRRPHIVGLLVPDLLWLEEWCQANGKPLKLADLAADEDLRKTLDEAVGRINKRMSNLERVRRFAIAPRPFTIENEQLTPKMTIRRHMISSEYGELFESLY